MRDLHMSLFGLSTIVMATNNFSNVNKIRDGCLDPVYKVSIVVIITDNVKKKYIIPQNINKAYIFTFKCESIPSK